MKGAFLRILAALVFLWVSHEREIHFFFFSHPQTHREADCDNHLHATETHGCEWCKIDFSLSPSLPVAPFSLPGFTSHAPEFSLGIESFANRKTIPGISRGPPAMPAC